MAERRQAPLRTPFILRCSRTRSGARTRARSARVRNGVAGSLLIAAHDLALAARALGAQDKRIEQARGVVADVLDGARGADASEDELDAFIRQLRAQQAFR